MTSTNLIPLAQLIASDLDDLIRKARPQFEELAGKRLWLTGGAGFLGYYLVLSIGHWNKSAAKDKRIHLTVLDNYIRGVPTWLESMKGDDVRLVKHDVTHPIPTEIGDAEYTTRFGAGMSGRHPEPHRSDCALCPLSGLCRQ